ncbi:ATP-dependent helicase [Comamonas aquatica]|uniref:DNA 3'-5' helicase n=1 Tax=Comamonas aquatica TaxID=225991 RepID=A0AA42W1P4_9BURK|nr:ATP-dependent helicase [Comamonas aquatica]MDH1427346.1 ATP-dependent helicase [Comamonas aquatica]MDH1605028.1 ATP-dependent helicase [Comamonas aquatica]MDH1617144.1 ATP-dependent helicase [Comamonas aquatica]MDH2005040.1 ATP-dependent helicase [Comamonas aquatica]
MKPTTHQRQIVQTTRPCVEVRASPGSGKTTTLIQRVKHLVRSGVSADQILVLSYSNNSVDELRNRFLPSLEQKGNSGKKSSTSKKSVASRELPEMQTIHAFARSLVAQSGHSIDVVAPADSAALLKAALRSCRKDAVDRNLWHKLDGTKRRERLDLVRALLKDSYRVKQLLVAMNVAQAQKQGLRDVMTSRKFSAGLATYAPIALAVQKRLARAKTVAGKLDFGDMLEQAVAAIEDGARIPYTHVLVDEFQDGSAAQNLLLATLAARGCQLMVFGDPEQAIYGFAGNNYTPLDEVVDGAVIMPLPESHRLTNQNAALAMAVAGKNTQKIVTMRDGVKPVLVSSRGPSEQSRAVVRDVQQLLEKGVDQYSIAVLARTKATLKAIEQSLLASDINTARKGDERDTRHVQRVLRLVRLVERHAKTQQPIGPDAVKHVVRKVKQAAKQDWKSRARGLQKAASSSSLEGRYKECRDFYLKVLGGVRNHPKAQHDINSWLAKCRDYGSSLEMLRATKEEKPVVQTMTIHAAKGGEWDHVLVVGVAEGQLPIYKAKDSAAQAEERRLLYVAITRARVSLRLYYAPTQHARSYKKSEKLSRFLQLANLQQALTQEQG